MARTKHSEEFDIQVGGEPYVWWLTRRPHWSSDTGKWCGMALSARHQEGLREVVLEFPPGRQPRFGAPQLEAARIDIKLVANAIASAVAAGWEPLSRGKTVFIEVDATGL